MNRIRYSHIIKDLKKKMVFLTGPRQVGKTWLSKQIMREYENPVYLNFDDYDDRQIIKNYEWPLKTDLLVFDELHKMENWKTYIKGVYDTKKTSMHILVTGSARLHTFRKTGESLAGRFFLHRLMPFSPSELKICNYNYSIDRLIERGGFPEPFLEDDVIESERWRRLYIDGLIREDILAFDNIQFLNKIDLLIEMLRHRVASPLSIRSISEDLKISPTTVSKYVSILEALFIVFTIRPYSRNIARSVLKEPKLYFYDTGMVKGDDGARLENLAAVSLLKHCLLHQDLMGEDIELRYLRTRDGKEVDFCFVQDGQIKTMLEIKNQKSNISTHLRYFREKYDIAGIQLVKEIRKQKSVNGIDVLDLQKYLSEMK